MVMGNTYAQNTLVFDHIHRRDAQSEGIQHYPQRPVGSHEDYTRDIAQSMEAKVEESTKKSLHFFSVQKHQLHRGFMFHGRAEAAAVHTEEISKRHR